MKLNIYNDLESLSLAAADLFVEQAQTAVENNQKFSVALSGGTTPERLYTLLVQKPWVDQVPWKYTHVFWGDERCVPTDDVRHNALMAHKLLLNHVPIPSFQIHPIQGDRAPNIIAEKYELLLRGFFNERETCFDFMLLGFGNDGHTASLFPNTPTLNEKERWVVEVMVPTHEFHRITLTNPIIKRSRLTVFLVQGAEKASALKTIIEGPRDIANFPAQLIKPLKGELIWLVDKAAAGKLSQENSY